jgi:hypothetical protein
MAIGKLGAKGGFGRSGAALGRAGTSGPAAPSAPVLSLASESAGLITLNWDVNNTVAAGDTLTRQVQIAGGNWSSLLDNTSHVITSGEDTANQITASQYQAPSNASYDIRGDVTSAATSKTSSWSNILTVVVSDIVSSSPTYYILGF